MFLVDNKCSHLFGIGRSWPISRGRRSLFRVSILDATALDHVLFVTLVQTTRRRQKNCNIFFCGHCCWCVIWTQAQFILLYSNWHDWRPQGLLVVFSRQWIIPLAILLIYLKHLWAQIWHWKDGGYWRPSWVAMDSEIISLTPFLRCRICN